MVINLINKPGKTFPKEHQTGTRWFDGLLRVKVVLLFLGVFRIYFGSYFCYVELIMSVSRTRLMPSGSEVSTLC